jgi:hypothetical protein
MNNVEDWMNSMHVRRIDAWIHKIAAAAARIRIIKCEACPVIYIYMKRASS